MPSLIGLLLACVAPTPNDAPPQDSVVPDDTAWPDVEEEVVEGFEQPDGLCTLVMNCAGEIEDEARTRCDLSIRDSAGNTRYDGRIGIETRGRSSSAFPKPQYSFELQDDDGEGRAAELLGMGREADWILNGAYIDRAFFRNKLAYDLFQSFGGRERYAPESRFCTLTLDGEPRGIYLLGERIERDGSRVRIDESDSGATFILKLDDEDGVRDNRGGRGTWQAVYPDLGDGAGPAAVAIGERLDDWMDAYSGADPGNPDTGVFQHVDMASSVDLVLLQELMRNNDAYFLSLYLWQDTGGPMHWAPWDLDLTLGQPSYNDNENPEGWVHYRSPMIEAMGQSLEFRAALSARWAELRQGEVSDEAMQARVDAYLSTLGDAPQENFEIWPIEDIEFGWSGENYLYAIGSFEEEISRVRAWIPQRLAWIDDNIDAW